MGTDAVSPASRAVLLLHYREEMTLPEVAAVLELPTCANWLPRKDFAMPNDTNRLQKALDRVDSLRRRAQVAALVAMVLVLGALFWFGRLTRTTTDGGDMLRAALQVQTILTLATGFMVTFWVSHMTQRVLRAIQLSSSRTKE